jgi:hypothetical protein
MTGTDESPGPQDLSSNSALSGPFATTRTPRRAVPLALHAGWTMALLYGGFHNPPTYRSWELPSAHEQSPDQRLRLELHRLRFLLKQLASLPECAGSGLPTEVPVIDQANDPALVALNQVILDSLVAVEPEVERAYELGRLLGGTVNPPRDPKAARSLPDALARQLAPLRVAALQGWLAALYADFPQHAAAVVAGSLGRWSEFAAVTVGMSARLKGESRADLAERMCDYLLRQGDLWLMLLVGRNSVAGLLGRSGKTLRRVRWGYSAMMVLLAMAVGAAIYWIVAYTSGALSVLSSIAVIVGALGLSAKGIASRITALTTKYATQAIGLEGEAEEEAMVQVITRLPSVRLASPGVLKLRRAGITPPAHLGGV